jgi:ABC-type bacteriocin/lantibiotic exporter with double-glycine peptidase domain
MTGTRSAVRWSSVGWDVIQGCADGERFAVETRPQLVADCLYVGLLAVLMASFSAVLLIVSLAFAPLYVLVEAWAGRRAEHHAAGSTVLRSQLSARYFEAAAATDLIHSMSLGGHVAAQWSELDGRLAAARYRLALSRRLSSLAVEFLQKVSLLVIMLLGVTSVIAGAMTLGQYIAFNLLSMQLAQPLLRLAAYRRARDDNRLLAQSRRQLEQRCGQDAWPAPGTIRVASETTVLEVDNLALSEAGSQRVGFVLRDGFWLGVVGASGCGKTTLLRTLAGLHEPRRGQIRLNGVPLGQVDAAERSRLVRLVAQEPVIFSASIAENIRLGDLSAHPQQILAAASVCGLQNLLDRLPDHLNTLVGPAGRALSGGERQRITIARAILSRPRVLLLDEATAALDGSSEAELLGNLRRYLPGAAVVVVSHRASSLSGCQQVLRLDGVREPVNQGRDRPAVARVV